MSKMFVFYWIVVFGIALALTIIWYDWKLALILFMWEWSQNIDRGSQ